jgi:hypothetical protein
MGKIVRDLGKDKKGNPYIFQYHMNAGVFEVLTGKIRQE